MSATILAIESSCDDTSAAVVRDGQVLSNVIANQEVHKLYGGVVPEVASRAHQVHVVPVVDVALHKAGVPKEALDAIAFTRGPGLIGSLMVGVIFAKAMSLALDIPLIEVNHMDGHVMALFAEAPTPPFPFLCLTVSGGHTLIHRVTAPLEMELLGQTRDDAAGEAFDKTGKLLGLDYPAGPRIDRLAREGTPRFAFPHPDIPGYDFSFSGLKTAILYFLQKKSKQEPNFVQKNLADICASVQHSIVTILMDKLIRAAQDTGIRHVAIVGGVSANSALREALQQAGQQYGWTTYVPQLQYCTDNAAMIGLAGYYKWLKGEFSHQEVTPVARYHQL